MNKKIIIAILIIILIAIVGIFAFGNTSKADTQINFLNGTAFKNGESIEFQLNDANGNPLANQEVTITFGANGNSQNYTVVTDSEGKGALLLNDEELGEYNITVTYAGDDGHNGCVASQTITITDEDTPSDSSNDSESSAPSQDSNNTQSSDPSQSDLNYDSDLNVHYDSNGKIVGGQNDGMDYDDLKNNPPQVDDEGNLV